MSSNINVIMGMILGYNWLLVFIKWNKQKTSKDLFKKLRGYHTEWISTVPGLNVGVSVCVRRDLGPPQLPNSCITPDYMFSAVLALQSQVSFFGVSGMLICSEVNEFLIILWEDEWLCSLHCQKHRIFWMRSCYGQHMLHPNAFLSETESVFS